MTLLRFAADPCKQGTLALDGWAKAGSVISITRADEAASRSAHLIHSGSPTTTGWQTVCSAGQPRAIISGPIPATSPMVISNRGNTGFTRVRNSLLLSIRPRHDRRTIAQWRQMDKINGG